MFVALRITELKKGTIFRLGDEVYRVVDYAQKVIGRGDSIVNVRIKNVLDGRVQERTFKGNEQLEKADVTRRDVQYLYSDGTDCHFMDNDSYEQFSLPVADLDDKTGAIVKVPAFIKQGDIISVDTATGVYRGRST